ncbi:hypothetical protein FRC09_001563 [Ceratobasidium sp. 395]|nr:hypothetical protein FRC09_001563 [Ceratobasidium sp. 395]
MSLVSHIARSGRPWLSLHSRSPRQRKAMVLHGALHSLPPSLAETVSAAPASDFREMPQDIPAQRHAAPRGRNLVLCFDGTGQQYDEDNTNIVRLFGLLGKRDPSRQMAYYQAGIGTGITSNAPSDSLLGKVDIILDQAFATGLPVHVRDKEGDRISLFGFSRGAYTVRALAEMIQKVGLLPAHNKEQIKYAYQMLKRDDEAGRKLSTGFKRTFSAIDIKIDFVGVFDTVNSVGIIIPKELPFATCNYQVRVFRHALALDERRVRFKAQHWGHGAALEEDDSHYLASPHNIQHLTDVQEVWFAGAHSDVGGGAVLNETVNHLAQIPLRWMIRECLRNTNIEFDFQGLEAIGLDHATLSRIIPPTPPELKGVGPGEGSSAHYKREKLDKATSLTATDASCPSISKVIPDARVRLNTVADEKDVVQNIHDRLSRQLRWWILEFLPTWQRLHDHQENRTLLTRAEAPDQLT